MAGLQNEDSETADKQKWSMLDSVNLAIGVIQNTRQCSRRLLPVQICDPVGAGLKDRGVAPIENEQQQERLDLFGNALVGDLQDTGISISGFNGPRCGGGLGFIVRRL